MEHKVLLGFLFLFLGFSCVLSSRSLLPSAHLKATNEVPSPSVQEFVDLQGSVEQERNYGEDRRSELVVQTNDYPGTGASHHHDPKTPPPYETKASGGKS